MADEIERSLRHSELSLGFTCLGESESGTFYVMADHVERRLADVLADCPHLATDDEGALLAWLRNLEPGLESPVMVPQEWERFVYVIRHLVGLGEARAHCRRCERDVPPQDLVIADDTGLRGWNQIRVTCPQNHVLLVALGHHAQTA